MAADGKSSTMVENRIQKFDLLKIPLMFSLHAEKYVRLTQDYTLE